ncbi:MAG: hypothetical protein ABIU10_02035, partial [Sphingomicrobium sp.]
MAATDLDRFRTALASATRAIARDSAADVVYAGEPAGMTGRIARVVSPGAGLEPRLLAEARGAADSTALRLRFHDRAVHAAMSPADAEARGVFDALETARVEALGSRTMAGVRANLERHVEARVRGDAIGRARSAEEVPLATAVGLILAALILLGRIAAHLKFTTLGTAVSVGIVAFVGALIFASL